MSTPNRVREVWQFFELYGDSGTVHCKLFSIGDGLELRLQSWSLPPQRLQRVGSFGDAQQIARQWLEELAATQERFSHKPFQGWWKGGY